MKKQEHGCRITWYGHSTFRIDTPSGRVLLLDPWFKNPSAPAGALETVTKADAVLLTHGHFDHLGDTVELARKFQPEVVSSFEMHLYLQNKGLEQTRPMNKGGTQTVAGGIKATMVHADHSGGAEDEQFPGQPVYTGEPCGFVLEVENGFRMYYAGDTNLFGDMALIRDLYAPQLAFLPIGDHFTMGPREAAAAARLLKAPRVIPMHYGTFPLLTGTPAALRRELEGSGIEVVELAVGKAWE